jgi:hypothetical protein
MATMFLGDFTSIQMYQAMFGGEIVFKGFPTESGNGNSLNINSGLSITTRASDRDGAWEFIRGTLMTGWQNENVSWQFPTNKASFDRVIQEAKTRDGGSIGWGRGMMIDLTPISQAEIDHVMDLINSIQGVSSYDEALMNIVNEGASDFFSGRSSAQDAARIIQNRASIYVAEQS